MIPVMPRLKNHHMAKGGTPQTTIAERCGTGPRSVERNISNPEPTVLEVAADQRQAAPGHAETRGAARWRCADPAQATLV